MNRDTSEDWTCDEATLICPMRCWEKCSKTEKVKQGKNKKEKILEKSISNTQFIETPKL